MTWEIWIVLLLLLGALVSFAWERVSTDQTAFTVFAVLLFMALLPFEHQLPTIDQLLNVFANPAPLTIAAMFIVSHALERCGVIERMASAMGRLTSLGYHRFVLVLVLGVAFISAFINNTPVVVVFLPVVLSLARQLGIPASKLLIPLSYASIFGGTCTLVGTSTNILASGVLGERGYAPLGMFELAAVGIPLLISATTYLLIFGRRLLPERHSLTAILSDEERREYLTTAFVRPDASVVGKTVKESGLLRTRGLRLLEIIRNDVTLPGNPREARLEAGDRLVLAARPSGFAHARSVGGIELPMDKAMGLEQISAHEGSIVEGVIGPRSDLIGHTVREVRFRQRYRMILLAIHRRGENLREKIDTMPLREGDIVLLMGTGTAIEELRSGSDILLLDRPATPARSQRRLAPIALSVLAGVIIAASWLGVPIVAATLIGVVILASTGVISLKQAYQSIEWSILVLIYGMLALGTAMETSGAADLVAGQLVRLAALPVPDGWQMLVLLAAMYLATMVLTELLSNNATIVLMAPIAIGVGEALGIDPRPFVIATAIAASASFSTPIGYQTNTYVYGVGGYRFTDFARIGVPLNLLYMVGSVVLIPLIWSF